MKLISFEMLIEWTDSKTRKMFGLMFFRRWIMGKCSKMTTKYRLMIEIPLICPICMENTLW
jgi:hypothetical protein